MNCKTSTNAHDMTAIPGSSNRAALVKHALRLEYLTVGWNVVEGAIAVTAALAAGSVALLGFGIDSFVESLSGGVLIWRLLTDGRSQEESERIEHRARRLVAISLFVLAAYVAFDAGKALLFQERPSVSIVGIVLTTVSILVMQWLSRAKRKAAGALRSRALEADAFQTTACFWLSLITLGGIALNAILGWWWADPAAALGMAYFIVREGREAWEGDKDCCG